MRELPLLPGKVRFLLVPQLIQHLQHQLFDLVFKGVQSSTGAFRQVCHRPQSNPTHKSNTVTQIESLEHTRILWIHKLVVGRRKKRREGVDPVRRLASSSRSPPVQSRGPSTVHRLCKRQGQTLKGVPWCCTIAAVGAGVESLPCRTVATAGADAKVSSAVTSSHCSSLLA